jgi:hypothetical protein
VVAGPRRPRVRSPRPLSRCALTHAGDARRVDAEWITSKKDWEAAKKRYHEQEQRKRQKSKGSDSGAAPVGEVPEGEEEDGTYRADMDAMRCILYLHGGQHLNQSVSCALTHR